jgi:diguanylate cyclase (GGDEF)-like protein
MSGNGQILLLADPPAGPELSARLGGSRIIQDPYQAMETLTRDKCKAVILTAPRPELASLCRALRRLDGQAKLLALSSVAAEPEVRTLVGKGLDDYFISPPTRADVAAIRHLAGLDGPEKLAAVKTPKQPQTQPEVPMNIGMPPANLPQAEGLDPREIGALVDAATSIADLELAVVDLVAKKLSIQARWVDASEPRTVVSGLGLGEPRTVVSGLGEPLLLTSGPPPRALVSVAAGTALPAESRGFLESLRQLLPALEKAGKRTATLHRLAVTDHLTGAYNRRYFYHLTDHILSGAKVSQFRVTLLLYDIDDFKHYNETYGHAAGDEILRETAMLMKRTSRSHDVVARIGGDEFAVLFWDVQPPRRASSKPLQDFQRLAERFRRAVSAHSFPSLGPEARGALTISGGLANFPADGQSCRDLLRAADQALRAVKRSGKNAIQIVGT